MPHTPTPASWQHSLSHFAGPHNIALPHTSRRPWALPPQSSPPCCAFCSSPASPHFVPAQAMPPSSPVPATLCKSLLSALLAWHPLRGAHNVSCPVYLVNFPTAFPLDKFQHFLPCCMASHDPLISPCLVPLPFKPSQLPFSISPLCTFSCPLSGIASRPHLLPSFALVPLSF